MPPKVPQRQYLGWSDAASVEWRVQKEADGRRAWKSKWGQLLDLHEKWLRSDIHRLYRKPSQESLEWLIYKRQFESPQAGEWIVRQDGGIMLEPPCPSSCKPCPWPKTTYGEIGWLSQHKDCQLEKYNMKYNQKPPLPWHMSKISAFPIY